MESVVDRGLKYCANLQLQKDSTAAATAAATATSATSIREHILSFCCYPASSFYPFKMSKKNYVIGMALEKAAQSNSKFNALHKVILSVHSVRMPVDFDGGVKFEI